MRQPQVSSAAVGISCARIAPVGGRALDHEHDRGRVFTADRQALDHAKRSEREWRHDAQHRIARQDAHQECRYRHRRHGEGERSAPPEPVADIAEQRAANGTHQEAHGVDAEGRQDLGDGILLGKERAADRGGEVAVDREIVPFEHVANRARQDDPARVGLFQD